MSSGGFFRGLFGKKPELSADGLSFDINESGAVINGKPIDVPCHLSVLTKMFGKPRKFVGKGGENVNYTWDKFGIYCYTKGNGVVYCIAVKMNFGDIRTKYDPKTPFSGILTVCGEPWETAMSGGEDMEVGRRLVFENYSLFAEFTDIDGGDKNGSHGAYSGIEIQLPSD